GDIGRKTMQIDFTPPPGSTFPLVYNLSVAPSPGTSQWGLAMVNSISSYSIAASDLVNGMVTKTPQVGVQANASGLKGAFDFTIKGADGTQSQPLHINLASP